MRRLGGLFDHVVGVSNLYEAWRDFRRGKRARPTVARFELDADRRLLQLHRALTKESYRPGAYRVHVIHEPKVRLVAAAPVRDRVVHHAIHRVLAPVVDRSLVETTFACLPGRGTHRAALCFLGSLRRYRYVLALDIRRYFLAIDTRILFGLLARKVKERRLLALFERILEGGLGLYARPDIARTLELEPGFPPTGCGLPIGNLTSQWWANLYLSGFDHFLKRTLQIPQAQRYMDDVTLFSDDRGALEAARDASAEWLALHRRLTLKHPDAPVRRTTGTFVYLGYRVRRSGVRVDPERLARAQARLGRLARSGDEDRLSRSLAAYRGWVRFL